MNQIFQAFTGLKWHGETNMHEDKFNADKLCHALSSVDYFSNIKIIDEKNKRRNKATPFFGWAACGSSLDRIDGNSKADFIFQKNDLNILIENKIIRDGKNEECNIKNALVQTIEYLNLYDVSGAIALIFDDGRAKERDWAGGQEEKLINCLTVEYPICIVRVRDGKKTCVYYKFAAQPFAPPEHGSLGCSG
jgi:hypothetical protein